MNKAISSFLNYVPKEEWILRESGLPWLELNIEVPNGIEAEGTLLYSKAVTHRGSDKFSNYQNTGWKSLTIYGESSNITEESTGVYGWTDIADQCPVTVEFIKQHWIIDQSTKRIRFMWLEPGGYILPHHDRDMSILYETNIAITHPDDCKFRFLDYGTVPFKTGKAFMVDISNKHFVYNDSDQVRLHIIVHSALKSGIVKSSYEQNFYS